MEINRACLLQTGRLGEIIGSIPITFKENTVAIYQK